MSQLKNLVAEDSDSVLSVMAMSVDNIYIAALELSRCQAAILRNKWQDTLNKERTEVVTEPEQRVTRSKSRAAANFEPSTSKNDELTSLLDSFQRYSPSDLLGDDTGSDDECGGGGDSRAPGKPYLIPDFVCKANHGVADTMEQEVCTQGGTQLLYIYDQWEKGLCEDGFFIITVSLFCENVLYPVMFSIYCAQQNRPTFCHKTNKKIASMAHRNISVWHKFPDMAQRVAVAQW